MPFGERALFSGAIAGGASLSAASSGDNSVSTGLSSGFAAASVVPSGLGFASAGFASEGFASEGLASGLARTSPWGGLVGSCRERRAADPSAAAGPRPPEVENLRGGRADTPAQQRVCDRQRDQRAAFGKYPEKGFRLRHAARSQWKIRPQI